MTDINHLRALLAAATPGPWSLTADDDLNCYTIWQPDENYPDDKNLVACVGPCEDEHAELMVDAVNSLPALLDRLDMLALVVANCENEACRGLDEGAYRGSLIEIKYTLRAALAAVEE